MFYSLLPRTIMTSLLEWTNFGIQGCCDAIILCSILKQKKKLLESRYDIDVACLKLWRPLFINGWPNVWIFGWSIDQHRYIGEAWETRHFKSCESHLKNHHRLTAKKVYWHLDGLFSMTAPKSIQKSHTVMTLTHSAWSSSIKVRS